MHDTSATSVTPRWLHAWAVLTVLATLPLLLLGAEVTTKGVGMIDPRGLRSPWHFFQGGLENQGLAWLIEHGHRLAGWIVGACVIVLTVSLWLAEPRRWVRWLGVAALLAVCLQGTLGIFRIELNAWMGRSLALVHGFFAQVVFTLLVCLALVTSRGWNSGRLRAAIMPEEMRAAAAAPPSALRSCALVTLALVVAQVLVGGLVRHQDHFLAGRAHLFLAFAVVGSVLWLAFQAREHHVAPWAIRILVLLVAVQVFLGIEGWLAKFENRYSEWLMLRPLALHADWFRSLHYLTGTLILATTVVVAIRAQQAATAPLALKEAA